MPSALPTLARDIRTIPNLLTLARIALILVAAGLYFYVSPGAGIVVAVVAGVTDYLDGAIARATGKVTRLGEILDQFSDLCFESLAFLVAISSGFVPPIVLMAYLFREFWVLAIRRFMAAHHLNIPSSFAGKLKTNFIMWGFLPTFLSVSGYLPGLQPWLAHLGRLGLGAGLVASYVSAWRYTRAFVAGYNSAG